MQNPFENKEIWFFTGSQDLYGPETLDQVAEQSQQVVDQLNSSGTIPVRVVWKPVLKDAASIRRAVLDANSADHCVGVMVWMHTFSPAKMWLTGLDALSTPLLHFHTQANVDLPWATIDMDFMNLNQAAHGDREFGYVAARLGVPRKVVVGHATQKPAQSQIATWARAATAWADLRNAHLVRFGDNMRNVAVTEGDKTEAELRFSIAVNTWGVNDLVERVDAASAGDIDRLVAEYEELYDVEPALRKGGEHHESLRYGAAIELGMRSFLEEKKAVAFTTNFEDLGGLRQLPGLAVQRLMADGYGFGAEGDWKTAILVRVAKVMGYGLAGGASLMEDYTYHMAEGAEKILGAHMLEVCPSLTEAKPKLEIHPLGIGDREDPVRLVFNTDSGPGVVVSLADMRERFRITANVVNVVQPDEDLPKLPVARAVWEPEPNFATSTTAWLHAGGAHHTAMSTAVGVDAFADFADIAQVEFVVIDKDTTVRNFVRELQWNAAYHRLAQGL